MIATRANVISVAAILIGLPLAWMGVKKVSDAYHRRLRLQREMEWIQKQYVGPGYYIRGVRVAEMDDNTQFHFDAELEQLRSTNGNTVTIIPVGRSNMTWTIDWEYEPRSAYFRLGNVMNIADRPINMTWTTNFPALRGTNDGMVYVYIPMYQEPEYQKEK